jgi:hypothetical protein
MHATDNSTQELGSRKTVRPGSEHFSAKVHGLNPGGRKTSMFQLIKTSISSSTPSVVFHLCVLHVQNTITYNILMTSTNYGTLFALSFRSDFSPPRPVLAHTQSVNNAVFWDVTPCSLVEIVHPACSFLFVASLVYLSTLKTEAVHSSETSVNFYPTTRHHIPEDGTLTSTLLR